MKTRSLIVIMALSVMFIVSSSYGQGSGKREHISVQQTVTNNAQVPVMGQGKVRHKPIDILSGEAVTITGTVSEITSGERMKDEIKINTGTEIVSVRGLGPVFYWTDSGVTFPVAGDTVSVDAYKVTAPDNTQIIIAAKINIGSNQIQLIDTATGKPMWDGIKPADGTKPAMALTGDSVTITGTVSEVATPPARPASGSDMPKAGSKPAMSGKGNMPATGAMPPMQKAEIGDLKINTGTETVTIFGLGPAAYWEKIGVTMPKVGDSITVNGLANTFMGTDKVIALSITINGQTIQLVDSATNRPLWMKSPNNPA